MVSWESVLSHETIVKMVQREALAHAREQKG
jgi:hypothetical protein